MKSELVSHIDDDDYSPVTEGFVWEEEDKIAEVSAKDWQEQRYLGHGPLTESDDEVRVFRFNVTFSQAASTTSGSIEVRPKAGGAAVALKTYGTTPDVDAVGKYQRRCWLSLTAAGLIWGGLSGAAFSLNNFPIAPSAALFGSIGIAVLSLTLFRLGRAT